MEGLTITEKRCPVCGKIFVVNDPDAWAYKTRISNGWRHVCSWHCLRAKTKASVKPSEIGRKIVALLEQGFSKREISRKLGIAPSTVTYWGSRLEDM